MKRCSRCKEVKPLDDFGLLKTTRDGHRPDCKVCCRAYAKGYYAANGERVRAQQYQRRQAIRDLIIEHKSVPCMDCGESYPFYVMQFDHLDGSTKLYDVGNMPYKTIDPALVLAEIEKCEVVCANCHAVRTWNRKSELTELQKV